MKFDATTLHAKPQMAAQQKMVDDGSGEVEVGWSLKNVGPSQAPLLLFYGEDVLSRVRGAGGCTRPDSSPSLSHQVWRVENNELVPVEKKWLGHFYGGDCYLILYTYFVGPKVNRIIYLWQVRAPGHCHQGTSLDWGRSAPREQHENCLFPRGQGGCGGC